MADNSFGSLTGYKKPNCVLVLTQDGEERVNTLHVNHFLMLAAHVNKPIQDMTRFLFFKHIYRLNLKRAPSVIVRMSRADLVKLQGSNCKGANAP